MLGPYTAAKMASLLVASVISAVQQKLAPLAILFRLNSKKGFYYSNSVYVCVIIMMRTGSMELGILQSVFK